MKVNLKEFASSQVEVIETKSNDFNVTVKVEFASERPQVNNQSKEKECPQETL